MCRETVGSRSQWDFGLVLQYKETMGESVLMGLRSPGACGVGCLVSGYPFPRTRRRMSFSPRLSFLSPVSLGPFLFIQVLLASMSFLTVFAELRYVVFPFLKDVLLQQVRCNRMVLRIVPYEPHCVVASR